MDDRVFTESSKTKVTNSSPFMRPVYGSHGGEPVTITHVGDAEGMSPVFLVVDSAGRTAWVRQSDVTITDPSLIPTKLDEALASSTRSPQLAGRR